MHAEIVMIGTELLLGELLDTNANRLSKALREIGLDLYYITTVGDNEARITQVLNLALDRADVVITSGGLGPTVDDVTRQAIANATGRNLVYSKELEAQIEARFRSFGRKMADNNKRQAYIPEGALPIPNPIGTAPCFLSEDVGGRGLVICLPGVPRELEYMLEHAVIPLLVERMGGAKFTRVRILRTCAVGESNVDRAIGDLMTTGNPTVGLAAHAGQTDVRITAKADSEAEVEALLDAMEAKVHERLGIAVYGLGKESVPEVVGRLLTERNLQLGIIDTLTSGQLARELSESGYGHLIATHLSPVDMTEALHLSGLGGSRDLEDGEYRTLALSMAKRVEPTVGLGLAIIGPLKGNTTFVALTGPGGIELFQQGRNYQESSYVRHWLVIQGLDWIRRTMLGQLTSPVDWN